ncbi:putative zinc finger HIT domain-containing protein 1-like [Capsicum annuum]|nr:putative zinc finger HIT domain-containing protein 1-like [Capsicum annuum]
MPLLLISVSLLVSANSVVVPIICIGVRKFGCYLRELSHETQAASYELRIDVSLEIKDADSLYSALNSFIRVEKLDDPEIRFTCEQCNSQVSIEKQLMLDIAPTIVVFHLKRFQNDVSVVQEGDKHVSFSLELDLLPYTENIQTNNEVVGLFSGGLSATSTLSIIVVVIYGVYLAIRGSMTAGSLTSFILYSGTVGSSISSLCLYTTNMKDERASRRVFQLLDCISSMSTSGDKCPIREKRIIELGSGYGLAGLIVAMTTEAREVFISDGNPQVVDYIQRNVNANSGSFGGTEVKPLMLHWGQEKDTDISNTFDVIIASDCTFFKEFHEALVQTIKSLLKEEGPSEAILLSPRRGDSLDKFLAEVKDSGLHFSTDEIYDAEVWRRHQRFIEGDDSWPNYEMDHCYPLLVRITR